MHTGTKILNDRIDRLHNSKRTRGRTFYVCNSFKSVAGRSGKRSFAKKIVTQTAMLNRAL